MTSVNGVSRRSARANYKPLTWEILCPRSDTHLTYMIDIAVAMEFAIPSGGAR